MVRASPLLLVALVLQVAALGGRAVAVATSGSSQGTLRLSFGLTGVTSQSVDSTVLRNAIAKVASVPDSDVSNVEASSVSHADDIALETVQVTADISAVNLAAPYTALTATKASAALQTAVQKVAAKAQLVPQSIQVQHPDWVSTASEPASTAASVTVQFIMTGVALTDVNPVRLRAVISSVAGTRLEAVRILSVAYAVAPLPPPSRRLLADGFHTLRVTAAVDAAGAAAAGSKLLAADVDTVLAGQLQAVLGASYRRGSLSVTQPGSSPAAKLSSTTLALVVAAAVLLGASMAAAAAVLTFRYCRAKGMAAAELPATEQQAKQVEYDAALWSSPKFNGAAAAVPGASIIDAKPAPAANTDPVQL